MRKNAERALKNGSCEEMSNALLDLWPKNSNEANIILNSEFSKCISLMIPVSIGVKFGLLKYYIYMNFFKVQDFTILLLFIEISFLRVQIQTGMISILFSLAYTT